ncbi:PTS sugar transporter subunit IIA [Heyndrickxia ginsengihumi]|uniref:PTS sugar transporter subunit IIA n=1 Tax=Heyndrickxia ginsengihumi TaxID=363870 RepID=UPI003D243940
MMKLLSINNIHCNISVNTKEDVFQIIAKIAVENGYAISADKVVKGLLEREAESTTGFLEGFAIPHTKNETIQHPGIIVQTMEKGVEWESLDSLPARFIIALLIPDNEAGTAHLKYLSTIAKMLMHKEVRDQLIQAEKEQQIYDILLEYLND